MTLAVLFRILTGKRAIALGAAALTLLVLTVSVVVPTSLMMTFASAEYQHIILRGLILLGLLVIAFSKPPRAFVIRLLIGALSSIVLVVACVSMIDYSIGLLDGALYLLTSIILALESIEDEPVPMLAFEKSQSES